MDPSALWAAFGGPPPGALLPAVAAPQWADARGAFSQYLREHGLRWTCRSPAALWALIRGGHMPRGATWRDLLMGCDLPTLLDLVGSRQANHGWKFAVWNARWLISPHTDQASQKRALIRRWLAAGRVVLLQETH